MIEIFLWWVIGAFLASIFLYALILYWPTREDIVIPDAHKYPYYKSEIYGFKVIPALIYCTPVGKKLVCLLYYLSFSTLISFGIYLGER